MTQHAPTVGIIGLGFGRAHIPAFQVNGCRVVALCQRDQPSAKAVADRYGVEHVFGRWEDMLETAKPEIVVIATPPRSEEHTSELQSRLHLVCRLLLEKKKNDLHTDVVIETLDGRVDLLHD